jgi:hypothetical protein
MTKLIPSLRVIRRTLECEIAYTFSRMRVLERIPAIPSACVPSPGGRRGGADGAASAGAGFNSVVGLRPGTSSTSPR